MSTKPRISQELRDKAKAMYLSGETTTKIADDLGLKVFTVRRMAQREGWTVERKEVKQLSNQTIVSAVAEQRSRKCLEYINPIVEKLSERAMDSLNQDEEHLSSKDHIRTLTGMLKLKAQISGELETQAPVYSPQNQLYLTIMNEINSKDRNTLELELASMKNI